jgi:hypothetical protein
MDYSSEIADRGTTYYTQLAAMDGSLHDTAVFVPDGYHADPATKLILYLHGWNIEGFADLRQFLHGSHTQPLRKAVGSDGRFALAVPWLQNRSNASHIVASTQAFDAYLNSVLGLIGRAQGGAGSPAASSTTLALSAHSGGGAAMSAAIMLSSGFIDRVVAAWAFDSMYGSTASTWAGWAKANSKSDVYVYYTVQTQRDSNSLAALAKGLKNVHVAASEVGHMETPPRYFPGLLKLV